MSDYVKQQLVSINYSIDEPWTILNPFEQSIKSKIENLGVPLKDWNISINYGIKTGLNEAFIIDKKKRDELVSADPKSSEIIRPILRGRDISRYGFNFQNMYLINTHNGYLSDEGKFVLPININDYPVIKKWLDSEEWNTQSDLYKSSERLSNRTDQGITPYNLRSLSYMDDFSRPKLMYPNMTKYLPFYLDTEGFYTNDKGFILSGDHIAYLTAYLNSSLFKFAFINNFPELQGGTRELRKVFLEQIPAKKVSDQRNIIYAHLIKTIQEYKANGIDTENLENKIDILIFEDYNLTENEVNIIDKFKIT